MYFKQFYMERNNTVTIKSSLDFCKLNIIILLFTLLLPISPSYTSLLLPIFVWDLIKKHHFNLFNRAKHRFFLSHYKKFNRLLTISRIKSTKNIKKINYTYFFTNKKFALNKPNSQIITQLNSDDINIVIDPEKFTKKFNSPLEHTNKKWFLNLTNKMIPPEVTRLLQFGEKFCMPIHFNKKLAIHEFIKDVESNMSVRNSNKQTMIRSITIPHFYKFLKSSPTNNYIDLKLDRMHNATKEFCRNNPNVIFTRADKGNITVALDKGDYIKKIEDLLNDTNTYTIIKKKPYQINRNEP